MMLQTKMTPDSTWIDQEFPRHVAIIMDGNRRWAYQRLKSASFGHESGANSVETIVERCLDYKIRYLTLFAFSTENWKRSSTEIRALFAIFENQLENLKGKMVDQGICLKTIGNLDPLPIRLKKKIEEVSLLTEHNDTLELVLGFNYGARDEIIRATKKIVESCQKGEISLDQIDETVISSYLDTQGRPDPDLIIRTSGEKRMSNFLLWQSAYAEFYTTDVFWPDFSKKDFDRAVLEYSTRKRRRGA